MYDVGYNIEIGGRTGEIVFRVNHDGEDYINVCFEGEKLEYVIYHIKIENDKVMVAKVEDENLLADLMLEFGLMSLSEMAKDGENNE